MLVNKSNFCNNTGDLRYRFLFSSLSTKTPDKRIFSRINGIAVRVEIFFSVYSATYRSLFGLILTLEEFAAHFLLFLNSWEMLMKKHFYLPFSFDNLYNKPT